MDGTDVGILLIVLGIFTFLRPGSVLTGAVLVYGVFALITGIADIVFYVKMGASYRLRAR